MAVRSHDPLGAGASDPLDESYRRCRALAKQHGTTYYLSTFLLPRPAWRHVWALYAFCRCADEIVDDPGTASPPECERALADLGDRFFADLEAGRSDDPILRAVVHTVRTYGQDPDCFRRFLRSMAMDLTVSSYDTWDDLLVYMDGSAAVIGEMMLPILDPTSRVDAIGPARDLGLAFQLTNFLRDVAEDLDRGRIYIPREDLVRFDADPTRRRADDAWRRLAAFEVARCRALYRSADAGLAVLPPASARCVRSARLLYAGILDRIERAGYDVFSRRARVPTWRKLATVGRTVVAGP
ncbi:MAG TPA: phytoene/squalene synthase family protein [Acidimicrobiales bacterium]